MENNNGKKIGNGVQHLENNELPADSTREKMKLISRFGKAFDLIIIAIIAVVGAASAYIFIIEKNYLPSPFCSRETRLCADGTTITSRGLKCELAECPNDDRTRQLEESQESAQNESDIPIAVGGDLETSSCKSNQYPDSPIVSIRSGYEIKNSQVYFYDGSKDNLVDGADAETFRCLAVYRGSIDGRFYGKDKNNVFYGNAKINGADPNDFRLLQWEYYAISGNNVYAKGELLEGADGNTFKFNSANAGTGVDGNLPTRHYAQDKNNVYINQTKLPNSDPATYVSVGGPTNGYSKDKNNVYFVDQVIEGADPVTFEILEEGIYFKDKNFIYYKNAVLIGADPNTFTVLETNRRTYYPTKIKTWYAYDNNSYYKNNKIIGNRNSSQYRVIANKYLLNNDRLLLGEEEMTISDSQNLEYIAFGYLKDRDNVYSTEEEPLGILKGVSPEEFNIFGSSEEYSNYFKRVGDTISVLYGNEYYGFADKQLTEADANTFQLISWPYAKDAQSVFYLDKKIGGADPLTFKLEPKKFEGQYAVDSNNVFYESEKLEGADLNSFRTEVIESRVFGIDANSVYYHAQKLDGINPNGLVTEQSGTIIKDADTTWYQSGHCNAVWYVPESEISDPKNYKPPC